MKKLQGVRTPDIIGLFLRKTGTVHCGTVPVFGAHPCVVCLP